MVPVMTKITLAMVTLAMVTLAMVTLAMVTLAAVVTTVTGEESVANLRAKHPPQICVTRQMYAKLLELDGLHVAGGLTYNVDRSKSKTAVGTVRTAYAQFHERLAAGVQDMVDSTLRSYNKIAATYLQTYAITDQDDDKLDKIVPAIGFKDETTQRFAFLAFLNDAGRDVHVIMDNLLLYASMARSHKQKRYKHKELAAEIKKYKSADLIAGVAFVHDMVADTAHVADTLVDKEKTINRLSSVFEATGEYVQWLQIFDWNKRFLSKHLEKYARTMYEMSCELTIKTVVGVSKDIEQWNCNQDMTGKIHDYGFMSYDPEKDGEKEKTNRKKSSTAGPTSSVSDAEKSDLTQRDNHTKLSDWVLLYRNANNVIMFNNIQLELYVNTVGLMSGNLLQGVKHILQVYCVKLEEKDAAQAVEHVGFARSYLILFARLVTRMVATIRGNLNVDMSGNLNLVRMQDNLRKTIDALQVRKYDGETEFEKMQNMKTAVETELQPLHLIKDRMDVLKVKYKFIIVPVTSLFEFIELLGRPRLSVPSN